MTPFSLKSLGLDSQRCAKAHQQLLLFLVELVVLVGIQWIVLDLFGRCLILMGLLVAGMDSAIGDFEDRRVVIGPLHLLGCQAPQRVAVRAAVVASVRSKSSIIMSTAKFY